jgi:hypothetical protein
MFDVPLKLVTMAQVEKLVADKEPEGRHLEFKRDVPVSAEESKRQRKIAPKSPPSNARGFQAAGSLIMRETSC